MPAEVAVAVSVCRDDCVKEPDELPVALGRADGEAEVEEVALSVACGEMRRAHASSSSISNWWEKIIASEAFSLVKWRQASLRNSQIGGGFTAGAPA